MGARLLRRPACLLLSRPAATRDARWGSGLRCVLPAGSRSIAGLGARSPFDRQLKRKQKNWAAAQPEAQRYDYLREEVEAKGNGGRRERKAS